MFQGDRQKRAREAFARSRRRTLIQNSIAGVVLLCLSAAGVIWFAEASRPTVDSLGQEAVITFARMAADSDTGTWTLAIQAKLAEGELIPVSTNVRTPPVVGRTIIVHKVTRWLQPRQFVWYGDIAQR